MKKKKNIEILVLGAALFSMFFGAGNLIFPPILGLQAGTKAVLSLFGFILTGVGLPLLGVVAIAKVDGSIGKLGERISPTFSIFFGIAICLAIGPLLAIPRTGATSFEMAGQLLFPTMSPILFSIVYFSINTLLAINPGKVIDTIGKYLTPGLIVLLILIVALGVINPIGKQITTDIENPLSIGFVEGYQTMDAFVAILIGGMTITALKQSGISDKKEQIKATLKAGCYASVGLIIIYGGLGLLGSFTGSVLSQDISRIELIVLLSSHSLKSFGSIALALVVSLACLTTSVGITSAVAGYFEEISKGKLKYNISTIVISIFSAFISVIGVESIIEISTPILIFLYPITIVMIFITLFTGENPNRNIYIGAVVMSVVISVLQIFDIYNISIFVKKLLSFFPLYSWNLPWLIPAILGGIVGKFVPDKRSSRELI